MSACNCCFVVADLARLMKSYNAISRKVFSRHFISRYIVSNLVIIRYKRILCVVSCNTQVKSNDALRSVEKRNMHTYNLKKEIGGKMHNSAIKTKAVPYE